MYPPAAAAYCQTTKVGCCFHGCLFSFPVSLLQSFIPFFTVSHLPCIRPFIRPPCLHACTPPPVRPPVGLPVRQSASPPVRQSASPPVRQSVCLSVSRLFLQNWCISRHKRTNDNSIIFFVDLYYTNPQFYMVLKEPDESDVAGECTCVISLMQKQYRKRKMNPSMRNLVVGFDVHLVTI